METEAHNEAAEQAARQLTIEHLAESIEPEEGTVNSVEYLFGEFLAKLQEVPAEQKEGLIDTFLKGCKDKIDYIVGKVRKGEWKYAVTPEQTEQAADNLDRELKEKLKVCSTLVNGYKRGSKA